MKRQKMDLKTFTIKNAFSTGVSFPNTKEGRKAQKIVEDLDKDESEKSEDDLRKISATLYQLYLDDLLELENTAYIPDEWMRKLDLSFLQTSTK
jgi:hypothetical protein